MGDLGEFWNDVKEAKRKQREREGWVSSNYRTEKDREYWTNKKHQWNNEDDDRIAKKLTKLGIEFEHKSTHAFQVTYKGKKAMLYTGKNGWFLYFPQTNTRKYLDYSLKQLVS